MSTIDAQIKALQLKKKKIDYLAYVTDLVKNDTKCIDFKDVKDEVTKKIVPFLKELAEAIEKDADVKPKEESYQFTREQAEVLKAIASKVLSKPETKQDAAPLQKPPEPTAPAVQQAKQQAQEMSLNDKMNFAMNHRHLGNKRVEVINDTGTKIYGLVVAVDAPFIQVKTDTGPTISVPVEKVVPQ